MLTNYLRHTGPVLFLLFPFLLTAQAVPVFLNNASFEDTPGHSKPPWGWFFCGPQLGSPPDVHPSGMFGVEEKARDGRTYVGMVVRDVNTWETIGQRLETPLLAGQCYRFSIWLALPQQYLSLSRQTGEPVDYSQPAILRIWGGQVNCENIELLAASTPIYHHDWKEYTLTFEPKQNYPVVTLEVHYDPSQLNPYCGSLLLDNASAFLPIDCETGAYDFRIDKMPAIPGEWEKARYFLEENSNRIAFKPGSRSLEEQIYQLKNGQLTRGNLYLHSVALCIYAFPQSSMVIRIPYHNAVQYRKCREYIAGQLQQWGLSSTQWKIKKRKVRGMQDKQLLIEFAHP